jgi:hypothetical protein
VFPIDYFAARYFAPRYWPEVGAAAVVIGATPSERRLIVAAGDRGLVVTADPRRLQVPAADRGLTVT